MEEVGGEAGGEVEASADEGAPTLFDVLYPRLRELARAYLSRERDRGVLQPTALVHEAYIRLSSREALRWSSRLTFLAFAARVMRQVLVDEARRRLGQRRGAGRKPETLVDGAVLQAERPIDHLDLDRALQRLESRDARKARIVELRFFAGLTIEEVATATELSSATVSREWRAARAWLLTSLRGQW